MGKTAKKAQLVAICSIWRGLEIFGDVPVLLILQSYWLGARRFDEFCRSTGLLKTVVSSRLKKLVNNNCLVKVAYNERPKRYEYRATEQFLDLFPMALAMLDWERKWGKTRGKITVQVTHLTCRQITEPHPVCRCCRKAIDVRAVSRKAGPGVGYMPADYGRRRRQISQSVGETTELLDNIIQVVGDRWSALIVRSIFSGVSQYQRILEDTGISTNILADRLTELCDKKLLTRIEQPSDLRRADYQLTDRGRDVYPILITLMQWADKWRPSAEGPPLLLTHKPCGNPLEIVLACSACGKQVQPRESSAELFRRQRRIQLRSTRPDRANPKGPVPTH